LEALVFRFGMRDPADVAELAAYLCSDAARFANGSSYVLDGGWSAR
jgi:NAD(P)-dependent dehydrogenase (short-subunit alcohol dehydrogenase family)